MSKALHAELKTAIPHSFPEGPSRPPHWSRQRRILHLCLLAWTLFVGLALWWLLEGNGGVSVWIFQDGHLNQPAFSGRVQAIFRGEFGLQRLYPWLLFGPFLALVAWSFPLERDRLRRNLPLNILACLAFLSACHVINLRTTFARPGFLVVRSDDPIAPGTAPFQTDGPIAPGGVDATDPFPESNEPFQFGRLRPPSPPWRSRSISLRSTLLDLLAYGVITGLAHSVNFYGRLRERERRALALESNLAHARLSTLKAQLQPHFLFNSLNAVTALLRRDPRLAESTLVALSDLLRLALTQSERQELTLREELDFIQRYLEIQQTRFGDKLRVEQEIDPQALDCMVPTLVLQPLVENAIRHGLEPSESPGFLRISAARSEDKLLLAVEDNGVGLSNDAPGPARPPDALTCKTQLANPGTGIGLTNLRERLRALYGRQQKLELTPRATGGVIVRVEVPWHGRPTSQDHDSVAL